MDVYGFGYPRPQFVRKQWESLNGAWAFAFDDQNAGESEKWYHRLPSAQTILVPFSYESKMSGIGDESIHSRVWYERNFAVDGEKLTSHNYIIHFEGCDYVTKVWVNGLYIGSHKGGCTRFSFDLTHAVHAGANTITVKAEDLPSLTQMRGKQRWKNENFVVFYTQTTGIWKTVWSEYVKKTSLSSVKMTPHVSDQRLEVEAYLSETSEYPSEELLLEACVTFKGEKVRRVITSLYMNHARFDIDMRSGVSNTDEQLVKVWSPDNPNLYDIRFRLLKDNETLDEVGSYFAMREIGIEGDRVLLNGAPLYQRLVLNQGYWKDSLMTAPGDEALRKDVALIRQMGYNGVRMHQKVEDERFIYWCDTMGLMVWCECPAYFYYRDDAACDFVSAWQDIVRQYYNHPSVIVWTPFNESWGITNIKNRTSQQCLVNAVYYLTKNYDPYRPVVTNDGWEHTLSDIITVHDYGQDAEALYKRWTEHKDEILSSNQTPYTQRAAFADGYAYKGQPVIISEYGGIAIRSDIPGWGYGNMVDRDEFIGRFKAITSAIQAIEYVSGYCCTQYSDVQQEINGMVDMERRAKADPDEIRKINLG